MNESSTQTGDGAPGKRSRRRLAVWLVPLFFWSLPALLTTWVVMENQGVSFVHAFLSEGIAWILWALATPGILALVRWLPLERPHRARNIAIHIATAALMGVATGIITMLISRALAEPTTESLATTAEVIRGLGIWAVFGLLLYAAPASVGVALDYHRRLRERELTASRLESQLIEARLNALRMQLQPHFLFNALNSVSMLVRQGESATAVRMVARLSDLLRYVLDGGGDSTVPLREEIDFVGRYLEIEQLRFGDRLHVVIDVEESVMDTAVPGLLLQPLVENAVRHAVAARSAATTIELTVRSTEGALEIRLRDDGPGLPDGFYTADMEGIGLSNTRSRLAWTYGDTAGFTVSPADGGGTEVRLRLPTRPEATR
jgi:two-component system LytT family sensor kinase